MGQHYVDQFLWKNRIIVRHDSGTVNTSHQKHPGRQYPRNTVHPVPVCHNFSRQGNELFSGNQPDLFPETTRYEATYLFQLCRTAPGMRLDDDPVPSYDFPVDKFFVKTEKGIAVLYETGIEILPKKHRLVRIITIPVITEENRHDIVM